MLLQKSCGVGAPFAQGGTKEVVADAEAYCFQQLKLSVHSHLQSCSDSVHRFDQFDQVPHWCDNRAKGTWQAVLLA